MARPTPCAFSFSLSHTHTFQNPRTINTLSICTKPSVQRSSTGVPVHVRIYRARARVCEHPGAAETLPRRVSESVSSSVCLRSGRVSGREHSVPVSVRSRLEEISTGAGLRAPGLRAGPRCASRRSLPLRGGAWVANVFVPEVCPHGHPRCEEVGAGRGGSVSVSVLVWAFRVSGRDSLPCLWLCRT